MKTVNKIIKSSMIFMMCISCISCGNIKANGNIINESQEKKDNNLYVYGDVLPLGTIASVKDDDNKYMIAGYELAPQKEGKINTNKDMFDYLLLPYPIGMAKIDSAKFVDDNDVTKVYSIGFTDENINWYRQKVVEWRNKNKHTKDKIHDQYKASSNMEKNNRNILLPIGSIVNYNNKNIIILGRLADKDEETFDYIGANYQCGFQKWTDTIVFNASDINKIIYYGYVMLEYKLYKLN